VVDHDRTLWIKESSPVEKSSGGICRLRIRRSRDGVKVWENSIKDHWWSSPPQEPIEDTTGLLPVELV